MKKSILLIIGTFNLFCVIPVSVSALKLGKSVQQRSFDRRLQAHINNVPKDKVRFSQWRKQAENLVTQLKQSGAGNRSVRKYQRQISSAIQRHFHAIGAPTVATLLASYPTESSFNRYIKQQLGTINEQTKKANRDGQLWENIKAENQKPYICGKSFAHYEPIGKAVVDITTQLTNARDAYNRVNTVQDRLLAQYQAELGRSLGRNAIKVFKAFASDKDINFAHITERMEQESPQFESMIKDFNAVITCFDTSLDAALQDKQRMLLLDHPYIKVIRDNKGLLKGLQQYSKQIADMCLNCLETANNFVQKRKLSGDMQGKLYKVVERAWEQFNQLKQYIIEQFFTDAAGIEIMRVINDRALAVEQEYRQIVTLSRETIPLTPEKRAYVAGLVEGSLQHYEELAQDPQGRLSDAEQEAREGLGQVVEALQKEKQPEEVLEETDELLQALIAARTQAQANLKEATDQGDQAAIQEAQQDVQAAEQIREVMMMVQGAIQEEEIAKRAEILTELERAVQKLEVAAQITRHELAETEKRKETLAGQEETLQQLQKQAEQEQQALVAQEAATQAIGFATQSVFEEQYLQRLLGTADKAGGIFAGGDPGTISDEISAIEDQFAQGLTKRKAPGFAPLQATDFPNYADQYDLLMEVHDKMRQAASIFGVNYLDADNEYQKRWNLRMQYLTDTLAENVNAMLENLPKEIKQLADQVGKKNYKISEQKRIEEKVKGQTLFKSTYFAFLDALQAVTQKDKGGEEITAKLVAKDKINKGNITIIANNLITFLGNLNTYIEKIITDQGRLAIDNDNYKAAVYWADLFWGDEAERKLINEFNNLIMTPFLDQSTKDDLMTQLTASKSRLSELVVDAQKAKDEERKTMQEKKEQKEEERLGKAAALLQGI